MGTKILTSLLWCKDQKWSWVYCKSPTYGFRSSSRSDSAWLSKLFPQEPCPGSTAFSLSFIQRSRQPHCPLNVSRSFQTPPLWACWSFLCHVPPHFTRLHLDVEPAQSTLSVEGPLSSSVTRDLSLCGPHQAFLILQWSGGGVEDVMKKRNLIGHKRW